MFVKGSTLYTVFVNIKKREEKERAPISIFENFLEKLEKGKKYVFVKNSTQVNNPDQIFKIFKRDAFNEKIHTLEDTSNILGSLSGRKSLELEQVN